MFLFLKNCMLFTIVSFPKDYQSTTLAEKLDVRIYISGLDAWLPRPEVPRYLIFLFERIGVSFIWGN